MESKSLSSEAGANQPSVAPPMRNQGGWVIVLWQLKKRKAINLQFLSQILKCQVIICLISGIKLVKLDHESYQILSGVLHSRLYAHLIRFPRYLSVKVLSFTLHDRHCFIITKSFQHNAKIKRLQQTAFCGTRRKRKQAYGCNILQN